jgi:uncharacterized membrane protein YcaP (DUF421 family)
MNSLELLWGEGDQLSPLQMTVRAFVMFLVALILIRLGGMRIFGKKSALDNIIVIMLGAVMARGIVGASPFGSTVAASAVMIFLNMMLAWICNRNKSLNNLIKGGSVVLYESGQVQWHNLKRTRLSESDLMESLRLETKDETFDKVEKALLETNGRISFILKDNIKPTEG